MEYFEILNLKREPFSNSPDPDFFFQSRQHTDCLQKLEIALRLRRGLNVVIGDVGTGKTTLCRQLIRRFSNSEDVETYLILDPHFPGPSEFLSYIAGMLADEKQPGGADDGAVKEKLKQRLFRKGVDEKKTVVLIIDEGQKIPLACLEILRELLNYETNEYKLLQIVLFAQPEFDNTIQAYANFADRINLYHLLEPLGFRDTYRMIQFRLSQSGGEGRGLSIFTFPALMAVYLSTGGYPRKIINLCHRCILTIIVQNRSKAGWFLVRSCVKRVFRPRTGKKKLYAAAVSAAAVILLVYGVGYKSLKGVIPTAVPNTQRADTSMPAVSKTDRTPEKRVEPPSSEELVHQVAGAAVQTIDDNVARNGMAVSTAEVTDTGTGHYEASIGRVGIPPVLGRITLKKGESLWLMINSIYGAFNTRLLDRLTSMNPQIVNPDNVEAGTRIYFPAIQSDVTLPGITCWWICLGEADRLDAAFEKLRLYPEGLPPVRLIPHLNADGRLRFAVVAKEYFFDRKKAESLLMHIPDELNANVKAFPKWGDADTVFFADPFLS